MAAEAACRGEHVCMRGSQERHSGLYHFLQKHSQTFRVSMPDERRGGALEYFVSMQGDDLGAPPDEA